MKPIRNSAKAVIIQNERVLLTKNVDRDGVFYLFPGGGQEKYEELKDAVVRECLEEIGSRVEVKDIMFIREYIGKNHQFTQWDSDIHQVEFYFECELATEDEVFNGHNPDEYQIGVEWIELSRLNEIRIYPDALVKPLMEGVSTSRYIGDTN
ncbi:NUDIX domain-containing protein [Paenibacillus faecalis]|uniref:NUDIX domain-containing protein n=1 Tax=Paenibacillus faecalis TaxID=2079532 RepID=UPI000D0F2504|nr:NUDIX domain-containing protein [Paenibacillus faecalis]